MIPTHLGLYHFDSKGKTHFYCFAAGSVRLPEAISSLSPRVAMETPTLFLAGKVRIPAHYRTVFSKTLDNASKKHVELGHIIYKVEGKMATSAYYDPFDHVDLSGGKLGYLLEWLAVRHLKTHGITRVSTTDTPDVPRIAQLRAVGLPVGEPVEISLWLEGMLRGTRAAARGERLREKRFQQISKSPAMTRKLKAAYDVLNTWFRK